MAKRLQLRRALRTRRRARVSRAGLAMRHGRGRKFLDGLPHFVGRRSGGHGGAERDGDGIGNAPGPFPEEAAALETENAAPQAVEMHGDDGHVQAFDDLLHAALEGQHVAGAADGALGEDADHVAGGQFAARGADGVAPCRAVRRPTGIALVLRKNQFSDRIS